jgi:PRTRC genetic system protein C
MAIVKLHRVFRMGVTDFPDPDADLSPEEVLNHFSSLYPQLRYGKVSPGEVEGDCEVITMKPSTFKENG